jgi:uncharacterized protein
MDTLRPATQTPRAFVGMEATVLVPAYQLRYEGKDITHELAPHVISLCYSDALEGESDSLEITLEDVARNWVGAWFPTYGDRIHAQLGYQDGLMLPCGEFEVDELDLDGPPDVVRLRALGAGVKRSYRTNKGRTYENTTLDAIAKEIAARVGLQVVGTIETIPIRHATQLFERDLAFLTRLAREYGYAFSVKGAKLVFYRTATLKAQEPVLTIPRGAAKRYAFRDKVKQVYSASTVKVWNPRTKRSVTRKVADGTQLTDRNTVANAATRAASGDELNLNVNAENETQAQTKARAALERANEDQTSASLTLFGEPRIAAGVTVQIEGHGKFDGTYLVTRARHDIARGSGYETNVDLKKVR